MGRNVLHPHSRAVSNLQKWKCELTRNSKSSDGLSVVSGNGIRFLDDLEVCSDYENRREVKLLLDKAGFD